MSDLITSMYTSNHSKTHTSDNSCYNLTSRWVIEFYVIFFQILCKPLGNGSIFKFVHCTRNFSVTPNIVVFELIMAKQARFYKCTCFSNDLREMNQFTCFSEIMSVIKNNVSLIKTLFMSPVISMFGPSFDWYEWIRLDCLIK